MKGSLATHGVPKGGADLDDYLRDLSDDDLDTTRLDLMEDLSEIKAALQKARAQFAKTGRRTGAPGWYENATTAQRIKVNQLNAVCAENGRRKRARRTTDEVRFEQQFIRAAKTTLPVDVYNRLVRQASEASD